MAIESNRAGTDKLSEDLSEEIQRTVVKGPGEFVRCRKVGAYNYRCNWWAAEDTATYDNPTMGGLLVTTHRVRRSRFLRVTKSGERLVIRGMAVAAG
jgi:hypothetical protein